LGRKGRPDEIFLWKGHELKLRFSVTPTQKWIFDAQMETLIFSRPIKKIDDPDQTTKQFLKCFRKKAELELIHICDFVAQKMLIAPAKIRFGTPSSRWGSCNSKKTISINRRLIGAPASVIVHEFCHLIHMNHSDQFWNLVELHAPEHKKADLWLKENHFKLFG
jgi:predicted metal-dependent hydrolase